MKERFRREDIEKAKKEAEKLEQTAGRRTEVVYFEIESKDEHGQTTGASIPANILSGKEAHYSEWFILFI